MFEVLENGVLPKCGVSYERWTHAQQQLRGKFVRMREKHLTIIHRNATFEGYVLGNGISM